MSEDKKDKKPCPLSHAEFAERAKPFMIEIPALGAKIPVAPRVFSTGSLGFFHGGKMLIEIDGVECQSAFQIQIILVNSKPEAQS